jgi:hypothetical protein
MTGIFGTEAGHLSYSGKDSRLRCNISFGRGPSMVNLRGHYCDKEPLINPRIVAVDLDEPRGEAAFLCSVLSIFILVRFIGSLTTLAN